MFNPFQKVNHSLHRGLESSVYDQHPIQSFASARSRTLPLTLSIGITPILIYGMTFSLINPASPQEPRGISQSPGKSISIFLKEAIALNPAHRQGPNSPGTPPGGRGHREGTGTIDPRLAALVTSLPLRPTDAIDPDELGTSPKAERVSISLNPSLPPATGGNGLAQGSARDPDLGMGGLQRHDLRLVPTRQVPVYHRLVHGESISPENPVRIRILLNAAGVPIETSVVSGPGFLYQEALKAAKEWRFEPLEKHGLKAPLSLVLTFHPILLPQD